MKCLIKKQNQEIFDALGINIDKISQETDKLTGKKKKKQTKPTETKPVKENKNLDAASALNFFESMAN